MLIPLGVLSLGAIFAGFLFHHSFISEGTGHFWQGSIAFSEELIHHMHEVPLWVKLAPAAVMLTGLFLAWNSYIRNPSLPGRFVSQFRVLYDFLYHKWYFDELYDVIFVKPAFAFGRLFWKGDKKIIDGLGPDGVAEAVTVYSRWAGKLQSGYVYNYALVMLLGLAGLASWAMVRFL